jgi:hypothetical protein
LKIDSLLDLKLNNVISDAEYNDKKSQPVEQKLRHTEQTSSRTRKPAKQFEPLVSFLMASASSWISTHKFEKMRDFLIFARFEPDDSRPTPFRNS